MTICKIIWLTLLSAGLVCAQITGSLGTPSAAAWPNHAATQAELLQASDHASGTLASAITSSATTITTASASGFIANQIVRVDSEMIKLCAVSGTTLTVCAGGRGFSGSTAASHASGAAIAGIVAAVYHNQLATELVALEGSLFTHAGSTISGSGGSGTYTSSGPITISGQNGTVISKVHVTSTTGNCITVTNSTDITIEDSEIGPCGTTGGPTGTGNGIALSGSNTVHIYDNYIHTETQSTGCCDHHDGIFGSAGNANVTIQGNVIAYGEANIEFSDANSALTITGNFLLNPRGPADPRGQNIQVWGNTSSPGATNVTITNNYALSSTDTGKYTYAESQEDSINFGFVNGATVSGNFVQGGHSDAGCGIITDDAANNVTISNNRLLNTGQCGIGIADGTNAIVSSNKIYQTTPVAGGGNTAIYVWKQYASACGPTTISNNNADMILGDGSHNAYWDGGGCSATLSGNTFDAAADSVLTPTASVFAPPAIPPVPKNCAVSSPYTNNTSVTACSGYAGGGGTTLNGASWPNHAVTAAELFKATDAAQSSLAADITSTATTLTVSAASSFAANQIIGIGSELISICSVSGTTLTVCTAGRGFLGTTPASHTANATVAGVVAPIYHNRLAVEIASLEEDLFATLGGGSSGTTTITAPDHIVVVIEENHDYTDIIGSGSAPYINSLASQGVLFTNYFAVTHPSEPNYFALYAGSTEGVTDDDDHSFSVPTIGGEMLAASKSIKGYIETASPRKHNPWESFADSSGIEANFSTFPSSSNYASLPRLSYVIPDLNNDMHDGTVSQGDTWLQSHMDAYAQWAKTHNSLLLVVWDEDSESGGNNRVPLLIVGQNAPAGTQSTSTFNHYGLLRTIEQWVGVGLLANSASASPVTWNGAPGSAGAATSWPNHAATLTELQTAAANGIIYASYHNRLAAELAALEASLFGRVP